MRIFGTMPTRGVIFTASLYSFLGEIRNFDHDLYFTELSPVSLARNNIVEHFLKTDCDYLFTMDDDEIIPNGALKKMIELQKDIMVIDAPARKTGKSNLYRNRDGSIAASGFGCSLLKREVFEKVPYPWFDLLPRRKAEKIAGSWNFPIIDENKLNEWGGEDINFSLKLKNYGFEITALSDVICEHLECELFNSKNRAVNILEIKKYGKITGEPM